MTLLEELMKQYKTTMEDLMIYTNLAEDKLMSFITGDISILDCPAKIFAVLAKTFGLIEKFDCIRGYRLPKLIYPYSFNFANNPNMIKKALAQAIPEFYRHGIVEGDIFNVC